MTLHWWPAVLHATVWSHVRWQVLLGTAAPVRCAESRREQAVSEEGGHAYQKEKKPRYVAQVCMPLNPSLHPPSA